MQSLLSDRQPLGHFPFKLPLTLSDPTPRSLQPLAKQGDGNSAGAIKENSHRFAAGRNRKRMLGIDKEKPLVDEADERREHARFPAADQTGTKHNQKEGQRSEEPAERIVGGVAQHEYERRPENCDQIPPGGVAAR